MLLLTSCWGFHGNVVNPDHEMEHFRRIANFLLLMVLVVGAYERYRECSKRPALFKHKFYWWKIKKEIKVQSNFQKAIFQMHSLQNTCIFICHTHANLPISKYHSQFLVKISFVCVYFCSCVLYCYLLASRHYHLYHNEFMNAMTLRNRLRAAFGDDWWKWVLFVGKWLGAWAIGFP